MLSGVLGAARPHHRRRNASATGDGQMTVPWRGIVLIVLAPIVFGLTVRGLGWSRRSQSWWRSSAYASRRMSVKLALALIVWAHRLLRAGVHIGLGLPVRLVGPWLGRRRGPMELFANLGLGFETAFTPINMLYCFLGVLLGTLIGVLPGIGPTATIAMLLPITFAVAGDLAHHARRHLLRRAVRRLDHRDPDQPAGRIVLGGDRDRRLSDGAAGPGRTRAGGRGARLVLRRHGRDRVPRAARAAA